MWPKRNENGERRRLHNEELHSSPNVVIKSKVKMVSLGVTCSPGDPRFSGSKSTEVDGFFRT